MQRRKESRPVTELLAALDRGDDRRFEAQDLEQLPAPVRRYLGKAIPPGRPLIRVARLTQSGHFRLRESSDRWQPFVAKQVFTTTPPGFVWQARMRVAPLLRARVVDSYDRGVGTMQARMLGAVKLAEESGPPELASAALCRYLAEAVWFPTALLAGDSLEWCATGSASAAAFLRDRGHEVRLEFHFNDDDEIVQATSERYRKTNDGYTRTRWTASYRSYQKRDGVTLPLEGSVAWQLPSGSFEYWRGRIEEIEYES